MKWLMKALLVVLAGNCYAMKSARISFFDLLDYGTAEEIAFLWQERFGHIDRMERYLLLVSLKSKLDNLFDRYNQDEQAMEVLKNLFSARNFFAPHVGEISSDDESLSGQEFLEQNEFDYSENQDDDVQLLPATMLPVPGDDNEDEQGFIFTVYQAHRRVILNIIITLGAGIGGTRNIYLKYYAWQTKDKPIEIDATVPDWLSEYTINITVAERRVSCGLDELSDSGVLRVLKKLC